MFIISRNCRSKMYTEDVQKQTSHATLHSLPSSIPCIGSIGQDISLGVFNYIAADGFIFGGQPILGVIAQERSQDYFLMLKALNIL